MVEPFQSPYLVTDPEAFRVADSATAPPPGTGSKKELEATLDGLRDEIDELQRTLYADDRYSLLLVFQAMDAAGKDGTIRAVLKGANPAGFQVRAFKQPSQEEIDHDFLWRSSRHLPERGRIGVFNRSYYEEVLVVRVHPKYLLRQRLPHASDTDEFWERRYESIREHEQHLSRNGTVVLKFWLNVSRGEQRRRFLKRADDPTKQWKFSANDIAESRRWEDYMNAYEHAIRATARPWGPWYVIPADNKRFMRVAVARIVVGALASLDIEYPTLDEDEVAEMMVLREQLRAEAAAGT